MYFFFSDKAKPSFPGRGISSADSCKHGLSHLTYRERKEAEKKIEEDKTRSERLKILDVSTAIQFYCWQSQGGSSVLVLW